MIKTSKAFKKVISMALMMVMLVTMCMPAWAYASETDVPEETQIHVMIENETWTTEDGAPWSGTLVDKWVAVDENSTLLSSVSAALEASGEKPLDENVTELTSIKDISNGQAGADCKWKASVNDADINEKFADYSVMKGNIKANDVIRISYEGNVNIASEDQDNETATNDDDAASEEEESDQDKASDTKIMRNSAGNTSVGPENGVRVVVENNVYKDGAWNGTLVDTWVPIQDDSSVMSCFLEALKTVEATQTGAEYNYITEINGLMAGTAEDCGGMDGWMVALNDWMINEGMGAFTVKAGKLEAGDVIQVFYSLNMGEDFGGTFSNNDKTVRTITFNAGELDKEFSSDIHEYKLLVPEGTTSVIVTPTASNKNFQVRNFVGEKEYKRTAAIPVEEGTVITVKCGDPAWPTMNGGSWGGADSIPAEEYKITVEYTKAAKKPFSISSLIIHAGAKPNESNVLLKNENDTAYDTENIFKSDKTDYVLGDLADSNTYLRFIPVVDGGKAVIYYGDGKSKDRTLKSGSSTLVNCLEPGENNFTIEAVPEDTDAMETQVYNFKVNVYPTLSDIAASASDVPLYLDKTFAAGTFEYTLTVPEDADTVDFKAAPKKDTYTVTYNGSEDPSVNVKNIDVVEIKVTTADGKVSSVYKVSLKKVETMGVSFDVDPKDAVVKVYDSKNANVEADEDGAFYGMFADQEYTYVVTKYGYIAKTGKVPAAGGLVEVELEKAPDDGLKDVDSDWDNFRGSDSNMAITDAATPISPEDTAKLWNVQFGTGWNDAPSVQIIVDNTLVVMCNKAIYKLDLETGEILKKGEMVAAPSYGYTPPIYAEGMIICSLGSGTVQAFNAETLESLWIYKDKLGGQSLSPMTYSDGYIYTGFWNSEIKNANYVCISVTDEDPGKTDESKLPTWIQSHEGGYYWAGSVAVGEHVIFGTDDGVGTGSTGTPKIYSLDKETGEVVSCLQLEGKGDIRSSMAYDEESGKIFFTTKGGYLGSVEVNEVTGKLTNLKTAGSNAKQITSTPVVYKGKVYYATGGGITSTGSKGEIVVADADSLKMLYAVELKGYPQSSLLLSTAYEEETGYIYLYSTYNAKPGGISMLKVKPEAVTAAEAELIELYDAEGYEQNCIASIICGKDGTLYYKNDSLNVFAIGLPDAIVVRNLITKIGDPDKITLASEYDIEDAREAYDALSDEDKAKVTNYETLVAAEKRLVQLQAEESAKDQQQTQTGNDPSKENAQSTVQTEDKTDTKALSKTKTKSINAKLKDSEKKTDKAAEEEAPVQTNPSIKDALKDGTAIWPWIAMGAAAIIAIIGIAAAKRRKA